MDDVRIDCVTMPSIQTVGLLTSVHHLFQRFCGGDQISKPPKNGQLEGCMKTTSLNWHYLFFEKLVLTIYSSLSFTKGINFSLFNHHYKCRHFKLNRVCSSSFAKQLIGFKVNDHWSHKIWKGWTITILHIKLLWFQIRKHVRCRLICLLRKCLRVT